MAEASLYLYSPNTLKSTALNMTKEVSVTGLVSDGKTYTSRTYPLTLEKLEYHKKMYHPCWIKATIKVGPSTSGGSLLTHKDMEAFFSKMNAELAYGDDVVATNCFVFKVRTSHKRLSSTTVTVDLDIYSEDKLLTLEKYSKAYTAKRLGQDIFNDEVGQYSFSATPEMSLQILSYGSTNEIIQPYLVQYNESFYDFLRRTANRCGEFLYFEDGKLHLGVKLNRLDEDRTENDQTVSATDYAFYAFECTHDSLYDKGGFSDGTRASDYAYNYMEKTSGHFAKSNHQYNDPLATDDYLDVISEDYTSYMSELDDLGQIAMKQILLALSGTSLSEIISNMAVEAAFNSIEAAVSYASKNGDNKEVNITPWKDSDGNPQKPEQWNSDQNMLCQFGLYDDVSSQISKDKVNLNALFYSLVRNAEKKVGENCVFLEFGSSFKNLKLGDVIKVDGDSCLVIEVSGSEEYVNSSYVSAQQRVVAIPLYVVPGSSPEVSLAIPQALPDAVKKSQPQLAFITDELDPKKIGRVRIRYPWQQESDDASPWIRVSLPFATDGGGIKFRPVKDDEVLVDYEEGNVERPYVAGYLLSERSNKAWGSLSDRSIVSRNGHGIIFEDKPGSDFFYSNIYPGVAMLKSFVPTTKWGDGLEDKASCNALAGGIKICDKYGLYEISASSDSRAVKIESAFGNVSLNAFTGISITAPNGDISISGKNVEITASNNLKLTSGKGIKDRFVQGLGESGSLGKDIGIFAVSNGLNIVADTLGTFANKLVSDFLDLSLFRTVLEVILRPIDGTTTIKSHTFVQIEAGKGSVEFPADQLKKEQATPTTFVEIKRCLDAIPATVNTKVEAINAAIPVLAAAIEQFKILSRNMEGLPNKGEKAISFDTVKGHGWKKTADELKADAADFKWDNVGLKDKDLYTEDDMMDVIKSATNLDAKPNSDAADYKSEKDKPAKRDIKKDQKLWDDAVYTYVTEPNDKIKKENKEKEKQRQALVDCVNSLSKAFSDLFNAFDGIDNIAALSLSTGVTISQPYSDKCFASIKKYKTFVSATDSALFDILVNNKVAIDTDLSQTLGNDVKKRIARKAVHDFMSGVATTVNSEFTDTIAMLATLPPLAGDVCNDSTWVNVVNGWFAPIETAPITTIGNAVKGVGKDKLAAVKDWFVDNYFDPWKNTFVSRHRWKTGVQGKILLSDSPESTISFEKDGSAYRQVNAVASSKYICDLRDYIKSL